MSYSLPFMLIGCDARKMVRILPLILYVICWSRTNKSCLKKGSLVEKTRLTCWKVRSNQILKNVVERINDQNLSTNLQKRIPKNHHCWLINVGRRRPIGIVQRWDISTRNVGRKWRTLKERSSICRIVPRMGSQLTNLLKNIPSLSALPRHYMLTPIKLDG